MGKKPQVVVSIVMGSQSDFSVMSDAREALKMLQIPCEILILSAHRTPREMASFAEKARERGIRVIIAGAGGAAHLPGMIAAYTELPVIGVPVPMGELRGQDALLSIVQMPKGVPVATVAIGNAWNAGILAGQIIGVGNLSHSNSGLDRIKKYKESLKNEVSQMKIRE